MKVIFGNVYNRILQPYKSESLLVRTKCRMLAVSALAIGLASCIAGIAIISTGALVAGSFGIVFMLLSILALYLLSRGYNAAASSLVLYGLWMVLFFAIKFDAYQNVYETYVFGTLGGFLLMFTALLASRMIQAFVMGVLNITAILLLYFLDAYPLDGGTISVLAGQNLIMSILMMILGAIFAMIIIRTQNRLIQTVETQMKKADDNYHLLDEAIEKCRLQSDDLAVKISNGAAETESAISEFGVLLSHVMSELEDLRKALDTSSSENDNALQLQNAMQQTIAAYNQQVGTASSAMEQMAASVGNMGTQASMKNEAVQRLAEYSEQGETKLAQISTAVTQVLEAAGRMIEKSALIEDIAERTNLLGLNASIEAAHAGKQGRGFAIVASHIRTLSQEVGTSSRLISDALKETYSAVESMSIQSRDIQNFFKDMSNEIRGIAQMLEELLLNNRELIAGSNEVVKAVETVSSLTHDTERSVADSRTGIERSSSGISVVLQTSRKIQEESELMNGHFIKVKAASADLRRLGDENRLIIDQMRDNIFHIKNDQVI